MTNNLTINEKLSILKTYGIDFEYDKDGAYRVLNFIEVFNITEIGNAMGDCSMVVSYGYKRNSGIHTGHIYFINLEEPWGYIGMQDIAREEGNEKVVSVSFDKEDKDTMSIDTLYYMNEV